MSLEQDIKDYYVQLNNVEMSIQQMLPTYLMATKPNLAKQITAAIFVGIQTAHTNVKNYDTNPESKAIQAFKEELSNNQNMLAIYTHNIAAKILQEG